MNLIRKKEETVIPQQRTDISVLYLQTVYVHVKPVT